MSRARLLAAVAVSTLALSSCSLFGGDEPTGPTKAAPHITQPQGVYLSSNSTAQLGTTVIDAVGYTLYRSDKDSANPPKSACDGACAQTWKPVPYTDPVVVEGLDQNKVGKLSRADGSEQVTLAGWPLYTKVGEQTGSVASSGKDGWFAVAPDGKKAAKPK
jgi:predicted lipoprotein with Yx(FWY)xxD motif